MEDGELDFSNQEMFSNSNMMVPPCSCSMDTFFDDLLMDSRACTHTHACNPPGPENTHTHTCFHVHTKILPSQSDEKESTDDTAESSENKNKKKPLGNREAVRKYREKKKAKTASLEDEVIKLKAMNQQLLKRLHGQAALEAEVARLKCLLVDIRGRIEGEIGAFPYQKPMSTSVPLSYTMNPCNVQCDGQTYCPQPGPGGNCGEGASMNDQELCGFELDRLQCLTSQNSDNKDLPVYSIGNIPFNNANSIGVNKGKAC